MIEALAAALDLENPSALRAQAARFRRPLREAAAAPPDTPLRARVRDVYEAMKARSA
jgi:hypothetical protein